MCSDGHVSSPSVLIYMFSLHLLTEGLCVYTFNYLGVKVTRSFPKGQALINPSRQGKWYIRGNESSVNLLFFLPRLGPSPKKNHTQTGGATSRVMLFSSDQMTQSIIIMMIIIDYKLWSCLTSRFFLQVPDYF